MLEHVDPWRMTLVTPEQQVTALASFLKRSMSQATPRPQRHELVHLRFRTNCCHPGTTLHLSGQGGGWFGSPPKSTNASAKRLINPRPKTSRPQLPFVRCASLLKNTRKAAGLISFLRCSSVYCKNPSGASSGGGFRSPNKLSFRRSSARVRAASISHGSPLKHERHKMFPEPLQALHVTTTPYVL